MTFLDPWILLRMIAGLTTAYLFARGAVTSWRVVRRFDARLASEAQLALERRMELASTFVRVGSVVQIGALVLTVLAADRLSRSVRGAMCAYGVFASNSWGFAALGVTMTTAFVAGVTSQLCALDRKVRGTEILRPLAVASLVIAPMALIDLFTTATFFFRLDLGVVASCCSAQLDAALLADRGFASGPRGLASIGAPAAVVLSMTLGWFASWRPRRAMVALAAAVSLATLPLALAATVLEVAPHAFELPQHACPFCLLRPDVLGIGYPLFGAIFLAVVWSVGAALGGGITHGDAMAESAVESFCRGRLRREVFAWLVALALGVATVIRYAIVAQGRPLFP